MTADVEPDSPPLEPAERRRRVLLLASVFMAGACGLIYELGVGALSSYLMGDSVTQYSLVIGSFLAAMGIGSWFTQWFRSALLTAFLQIQLLVGVVGGFSALFLFWAFAHVENLTPVTLACTSLIGLLVGMEIPLMLRILRGEDALRVTAAQVLSADYLGALAASVAFPFLMLPLLGLVRSSLACGVLNLAVASLGTALFWSEIERPRRLLLWNFVAWGLLAVGLVTADRATYWIEDKLYQDDIILAETTPYPRIVVTRWRDDYRLHLNGHLQFSSQDEYRYHEALVLPALGAAWASGPRPRGLRVLILGGGDGLAIQDVLAAENPRLGQTIEHVDLVDIDPRVVELFREIPALAELNGRSLHDQRVTVHSVDAMNYLRDYRGEPYDVVLMDLPDPSTVETNKLYTDTFFALALRLLTPRGVLTTQASSPFYARRAFWCVVQTLEAAVKRRATALGADASSDDPAGMLVVPYHVYVPSFGDWGFVMLGPRESLLGDLRLPWGGRFLTDQVFAESRVFAPDSDAIATEVNTLDQPVLSRGHADDWSKWGE